jgi:hypothetical protein
VTMTVVSVLWSTKGPVMQDSILVGVSGSLKEAGINPGIGVCTETRSWGQGVRIGGYVLLETLCSSDRNDVRCGDSEEREIEISVKQSRTDCCANNVRIVSSGLAII